MESTPSGRDGKQREGKERGGEDRREDGKWEKEDGRRREWSNSG